jgi:hypothetical protein
LTPLGTSYLFSRNTAVQIQSEPTAAGIAYVSIAPGNTIQIQVTYVLAGGATIVTMDQANLVIFKIA